MLALPPSLGAAFLLRLFNTSMKVIIVIIIVLPILLLLLVITIVF